MSASLILGIDGGGTKTHAIVGRTAEATTETDNGFAESLQTAPNGVGGPSNIAAVSVDEAIKAVRQAAQQAMLGTQNFADITAVVAAIAGLSQVARRTEFSRGLSVLFPHAIIEIVPDYVAAHAGSLSGEPGIIAIAGTGSVAYGENGESTHKTGAYGYLIDDAGSGYGVGRRALAAILHAADGTGPQTLLTEIIAAETGSSDWFDIITGVYGGALDRKRIASLSRCVSVAAEQRDDVATAILADAGRSLAELVATVAHRIFKSSDIVTVSSVGSLWNAHSSLKEAFSAELAAQGVTAAIVEPRYSPHVGAALLARRMLAKGNSKF